ncbi:DUF2835 domain-containing protein [Aliidiomarina minuta]|uniref:DUF2835 domain-containing protein n=1 Tax=Aliidiomarina minuta TaxID=880057 RepID=A0A432W6K8_9GAMM|nr:DUF2835 family protein [Aliidiomarina minuta]RUO25713.1 DUF2835 domain-containing protein [Aliidiomarina minuta]
MYEFNFALIFTSAELERKYYKEGLSHIVVKADNGLRVQIPLRRLVPFISGQGIRGRFKLITDAQYRFMSLQKLQDI